MAKITSALRFVPYLRPMVWGSRKLATELHKQLPTEESYGESWEVSDHALHSSIVAAGPFAGQSFHSLLTRHSRELLGEQANDRQFPWLIKFLDAHDWLSVQVHPDDALAQRLRPGECGKTEAWFILSAQPGSRIYAGLQSGIGPNEFRQALARGSVADVIHSFEPKQGDFVFLPAGTVHAVGGGVVLAEVQQSSDVTFRLFDWNRVDSRGRPRQLHIEEGLAAIDWNRGPITPTNVPMLTNSDVDMSLVRCPHFELRFVEHHRPAACGGHHSVQALIVLAGQAWLGQEKLSAGEVWLLPASLPKTTLEPEPMIAGLLCSQGSAPAHA